MPVKPLLILFFLYLHGQGMAQSASSITCGQKEFTTRLLRNNPALQAAQAEAEKQLSGWKQKAQALATARGTGAPVMLPVVIHIIHNNGLENISDAQVLTALQHLNEGFANTGYYDPADGVNTNIQFCLAQRDPNNNPTSGITRHASPYTILNPNDPLSDDVALKSIVDWDALHYINIWVVKSINRIGGYATLPYGHGSESDGIVIRADLFGTSYANDATIIHEMGHYLGLLHTFENGCRNTDCSIDGDRVCDTPPDQSTAAVACNQTVNSCPTDALSGFSYDHDDLTKDYMDYGNQNCLTLFTQGQSDRMNGFVQDIRASLLNTRSCLPPCPTPVTGSFVLPANATEISKPYTFTNTSSGAIGYEWYVNGTMVSTAFNLTYTFPSFGTYTIRLLAKSGNNTLCSDGEQSSFVVISCPPGGCTAPSPPWLTDTCKVNTFQKGLGSPIRDFQQTVGVDAAGNFLVSGNLSKAGSANMQFMKLDPAGNIQWAKTTNDGISTSGFKGDVAPDGSSWHIAQSSPSASLYKLDNRGNLFWSRNYVTPGYLLNNVSVIATRDGGALLGCYVTISGVNSPAVLIKVDGVGNVQWSTQYFNGHNNFPWALIEDDDHFTIVSTYNNAATFVVFTVDKVNGALVWAKSYQFSRLAGVQAYQIRATAGGWVLACGVTDTDAGGKTHGHNTIMYMDKQGTVKATYSLDGDAGTVSARMGLVVMPDGNTCFNYNPLHAVDPPGARLAILDPNGKLLLARRYVTPDVPTLVQLQNTPDGGIVALGNTPKNIGDGYLLKTDSHLRLSDPLQNTPGCITIDEYPVVSQLQPIVTSLIAAAVDITINASDKHATITDYLPTATDYCTNAALCDTLHITGQDSVCVSNTDTLYYRNGKKQGCALPMQWQVDPAKAKIVITTDSTVGLVFNSAGAVVLRATMTVNCRIITDSIVLHAFQSPAQVDLGGDLALCKQSTVLLHAGTGFRSYLWQNASIDSVFTAYLPGFYYVNARDYCGHSYGDTITISEAPDVPFDLGPDTTVCNTDTLLLTAPAGFSNYSWAPAYRTSNTQQSSIMLYPDKDTTYTCMAVKGKGCQVIDSIHIVVKEHPQHFLSSADAVCVGQLLELHATGKWASYKWFDNTTGATVKIRAAGIYTLQVTDTNGCKGKDSVTIMAGTCVPGVYFPNAFSADHNGQNDIFRPVVSIALDEYCMAVYDRLGEKVFETKDIMRGWDGTFKGKMPASNAFVWYARYHIKGSPEKTKLIKGTVILIR